VSEAIDRQREAYARAFIFPVCPARRCHRGRPSAWSAGHGRVDPAPASGALSSLTLPSSTTSSSF